MKRFESKLQPLDFAPEDRHAAAGFGARTHFPPNSSVSLVRGDSTSSHGYDGAGVKRADSFGSNGLGSQRGLAHQQTMSEVYVAAVRCTR